MARRLHFNGGMVVVGSPDSRSPDELVPAIDIGGSVADVAEACRQAFQSFLFGVASGWGTRELAHFLAETYANLAVHASDDVAAMCKRPFGADARVAPTDVIDLLQATRRDVLEQLEYLTALEGGKPLTFTAMTSGWVVPARDSEGELGWIPVAKPSMRLKARILSLVAADYMARSEDYLVLLAICNRCERAVFDIGVRASGACCRVSMSGTWGPRIAFEGDDEESFLIA
jgi:hypothetical protein